MQPTSQAKGVIRLVDYQEPHYLIPKVMLDVSIHAGLTTVVATLSLERNLKCPSDSSSAGDAIFDGRALTLVSISQDGSTIPAERYSVATDAEGLQTLTVRGLPERCTLVITTTCVPEENTQCMGLYQSGASYLTQMEPDGMRALTFFPDRSDILSVYTVRISADRSIAPVLISNGNLISTEQLPDYRHAATFEDPFPKPCYIFALVAGDLVSVEDTYITKSGRTILLRIYVERGDEGRVSFAMESLKKAMLWDEETFGFEYDLDVFTIVATNSFNFGAMENKSLNIFNARLVLADARSASDERQASVEGIVGHEYFHNYTGNRITCRDWFQLTLKEGLTRYRDQEFSCDLNSRVLNRIDDVAFMRERQFAEDAGPNAHAIRPPSYREVSNFYTPTVYEKGAEVIRMIETLLGRSVFLAGMRKYFELYDGQAVTTEDFLHAMELASGRDLTQFRESWYNQAGTPLLSVSSEYRADSHQYVLRVTQSLPRAKGGFQPFYLPFRMGLVGSDGQDLALQLAGVSGPYGTTVDLIISESTHEFVFEGVTECPVPSLLRNFSAPVKVAYPYSLEDLIVLSASDSDLVNRFAASRLLARQMMESFLAGAVTFNSGAVKALGACICDRSDPAYVAKALKLPSIQEIGLGQSVVDFHALQRSRNALKKAIADAYSVEWLPAFQYCSDRLADSTTAASSEGPGLRALRLAALGYLMEVDSVLAEMLALGLMLGASTMTDEYGALLLLCRRPAFRNTALELFFDRWSHKGDVLPSWFSAQVGTALGDELAVLEALEAHPSFDQRNPNLVRALYGGFLGNPTQFHRIDGRGYQVMADRIVAIDALNPQIAAGLAKGFIDTPRLVPQQQAYAKTALETLVAQQLSSKVAEIVTNTLAAITVQ